MTHKVETFKINILSAREIKSSEQKKGLSVSLGESGLWQFDLDPKNLFTC